MALKILYQDPDYVAIHKPGGMLVHHNPHDRHSRAAVQTLRKQLGTKVYPVHRLDRGTSGVMLFALSPESTAKLASVFQSRQVAKTYLTVVRGHLTDSGVIDKALTHKETGQVQEAKSNYCGLATAVIKQAVGRYPEARYSLVAVQPVTGRRHQIRRHLRSLNHPIIGDTRMGDTEHNLFFRSHFNSHRLLLTAMKIAFTHPLTQEYLEIQAPLDGEFERLAPHLGWTKTLQQAQALANASFAAGDNQ